MPKSSLIKSFLKFLETSPTSYHAVENCSLTLKPKGFKELSENDSWNLKPEEKYFVDRGGSSICAFVMPKTLPKKIRLMASHTDSPSFKLKPNPEIKSAGMILFGVEVYGAPIISSWFNRDLGLAGRVIVKNKQGHLKKHLVNFKESPLTIPQLAFHLDREVNEKGLLLNKQNHLNALIGLERTFSSSQSTLQQLLHKDLNKNEIVAHDLFLYPLEKPSLIGYESAFLSSYRIDSLSSVHATLNAILKENSPLDDELKMVIFWDHEEIGSTSSQGAAAPFFSAVVDRILNAFGGTKEDYYRMISDSFCLSIDLAHAVHPNYVEKHDANHQPILGQGTVIKFNAQQRYATSGYAAILETIAKDHKLNIQKFVSRNDIPCGSTIGPIHAEKTGMTTIDIGSPQLSMHSCRELMACQDHIEMCQLLEATFAVDKLPIIS